MLELRVQIAIMTMREQFMHVEREREREGASEGERSKQWNFYSNECGLIPLSIYNGYAFTSHLSHSLSFIIIRTRQPTQSTTHYI